MNEVFVGIDWGTQGHEVCILDGEGAGLEQFSVEHSAAGLARLVERIAAYPSAAIAIEVPRGAVVETMLERGFGVYAINPKQLDRFRDRHTVAGAKDDSRDAFVLADSLRTDRKLFRKVSVDDPVIVRLRELGRTYDELVEEKRSLANRLRELVFRYAPHLLKLCQAADEPWLWTLLERAPTPAAQAALRDVAVKRLLREHRIRRLTPEDVTAVLREPAVHVAPGVVEAASEHAVLVAARLRLVHEQCRRTLVALEHALDALEADETQPKQHRDDVRVLRSQPGLGVQGVAAMLAEACGPLRARDYHVLRAQCGTAPVTRQTGLQGKRKGHKPQVTMRRAVNPRLREAVYHWARVASMGSDPRARLHYVALRGRGHNHARAARGVADRLLARLIAMLTRGSTYSADQATEPLRA